MPDFDLIHQTTKFDVLGFSYYDDLPEPQKELFIDQGDYNTFKPYITSCHIHL